MTACTHCAAKAQLFLCNPCITDLRDMLIGLARGQQLQNGQCAAGWLEHLQDAALGHTKLALPERRSPRYRQPLDGESSLASQIEQFPNEKETDLDKAREQRQEAALRHALGAARINLAASEKLEYANAILIEWVRDICETRGVEVPILGPQTLALWLARNVTAIASDEAAHVCYREIKELIDDIERIINRPVSMKYCGNCPTVDEDRQRCSTALYTKREATDVHCWKCKTTYDVEELIKTAIGDADGWLFTAAEVLEIMEQIGEPISARTWRHWRRTGAIQPRNELGAERKYFLEEVRHLRITSGKVRAS